MKEHIDILKKFKEDQYLLSDIANTKYYEKLMAAINKSIKLLQKHDSRKKG
jgi:hypothetical protein